MATPLPSPPQYPIPPRPPSSMWTTPPLATRSSDPAALSRLKTAGLLGMIGAVLGWGSFIVNTLTSSTSTAVTNNASGAPRLSISSTTVELLLVVAGISALLVVVQLAYFLGAFRDLREFDEDFETPSKLIWLALIGLPLLFLSLALLLNSALAVANCVNALPPGASASTSCSGQLGAAAGDALLLLFAAVLSFVGWVALLLGVWRLEAHFREPNFRPVAVLMIFPLLNLIGFFLVWNSSRRLASARTRGAPEFL
ncbi:MAG: DUF973 family protein [Thermoplasmata archaeon]|nr:DUF973 family protein [Thermoplasmata archaeon]